MISSNDIRPGLTFQYGNEIYICLSYQHNKTARAAANIKIKMKNLRTGSITSKTFGSNEKFAKAEINKVDMQFLYFQDNVVVFMNNETYEQIEIPKEQITWELNFIKESSIVKVRMFEKEVLGVELPPKIILKVIEVEEGVKGNTATNISVKAKLETGFMIDVPPFIKENENIEVNTLNGTYSSRG